MWPYHPIWIVLLLAGRYAASMLFTKFFQWLMTEMAYWRAY
jgi:hypothetical protein